MLKFYRHSYPQQHLSILLLAIILWLPSLLTQTPLIYGDATSPLFNLFINIFDFSPLLTKLIALIILIFSAFLFNSVVVANRLLTKYKSLTSLCFVYMMSCMPELTTAYPFLFACPFIIMIMHVLFLVYQIDRPESYMMCVGYLTAIASMFYFPSIFLILWILVSFFIMQHYKLCFLLTPIMGMLSVYIIVFGITFLFGDFDKMLNSYLSFFQNFELDLNLSYVNKLFLIFFGALFIISFTMSLTNKTSDRANNVKKKIGIIVVLTLFSCFFLFISDSSIYNSLIFMIFSLFYAMFFSEIKKTAMANIIIVISILSILFLNYSILF